MTEERRKRPAPGEQGSATCEVSIYDRLQQGTAIYSHSDLSLPPERQTPVAQEPGLTRRDGSAVDQEWEPTFHPAAFEYNVGHAQAILDLFQCFRQLEVTATLEFNREQQKPTRPMENYAVAELIWVVFLLLKTGA